MACSEEDVVFAVRELTAAVRDGGGPTWIDVFASLVLPLTAILVSTIVAVGLARRERLSAAAARAHEEARVSAERYRVRRQEAFDRVFDTLENGPKGSPDEGTGTSVLQARRFHSAIGRLKLAVGSDEPELIEWLESESTRLGMIHAAAHLAQPGPAADPLKPGSTNYLVLLWNVVLNELFERLISYEASGAQAAMVAPWLAEVQKFHDDPAGAIDALKTSSKGG